MRSLSREREVVAKSDEAGLPCFLLSVQACVRGKEQGSEG